MRRTRKGNFITHNFDDKNIKQRILQELGGGEWKIDYHKSGNYISWEATSEQR